MITGGGQRVGLHCANQLLAMGERVAITYRTEHASVTNLKARGVACLQADFTSEHQITQLIKSIHDELGPLRAIVHNASSWLRDVETAVDHATGMIDMVKIHMLAPYMINLHCGDLLMQGAHPWSDIVHITDYVVEEGSDNHIAYAASKAGLDNMTRSFARRYAPKVKVNSVAPSLLMFNDGDSLAYRNSTIDKSLMAIEPGAEVVFQSLDFILSNAYMTGRTLQLDGGRHIRQLGKDDESTN